MGEILRLFGLTQDGAMVPYVVGVVVAWAVMSIRWLRADLAAMDKKNEKAHDRITENIKEAKADLGKRFDDIGARISDLATRIK